MEDIRSVEVPGCDQAQTGNPDHLCDEAPSAVHLQQQAHANGGQRVQRKCLHHYGDVSVLRKVLGPEASGKGRVE